MTDMAILTILTRVLFIFVSHIFRGFINFLTDRQEISVAEQES